MRVEAPSVGRRPAAAAGGRGHAELVASCPRSLVRARRRRAARLRAPPRPSRLSACQCLCSARRAAGWKRSSGTRAAPWCAGGSCTATERLQVRDRVTRRCCLEWGEVCSECGRCSARAVLRSRPTSVMLTAAAGRLAAALVMMLLALQPASAGSTVKLCGGRSVTVPLLGTYAFQVTAVYQDEKFGFRCVRPRHLRHSAFTGIVHTLPPSSGWLANPSGYAATRAHTGRRSPRGELFRQHGCAGDRASATGRAVPYPAVGKVQPDRLCDGCLKHARKGPPECNSVAYGLCVRDNGS